MTTLNLRVGDYVVVFRWNGQQYADGVERIEQTRPGLLLFAGWHLWTTVSHVIRNATINEAIEDHKQWEDLYMQMCPDYEHTIQRLCYHRQQIRVLQSFSGQAGKKSR